MLSSSAPNILKKILIICRSSGMRLETRRLLSHLIEILSIFATNHITHSGETRPSVHVIEAEVLLDKCFCSRCYLLLPAMRLAQIDHFPLRRRRNPFWRPPPQLYLCSCCCQSNVSGKQ